MPTLKSQIMTQIAQGEPSYVWTPADFVGLGSRDAIIKALQRMVSEGALQRVAKGLFVQVRMNALTQKPAVPDYQQVVAALVRRSHGRMLVDGMTAANVLGLTNAVPGQVIIRTDCRLKPIQLENLTIQFKQTAPSKLYWAGRPAMYFVQTLYWLHDGYESFNNSEKRGVEAKLRKILHESDDGEVLARDLVGGYQAMPVWMQEWVDELRC